MLSANGTAFDLVGLNHTHNVILIHGLGLNRHTWHDYVPVLESGFRVVNLDLYGHGESHPLPGNASLTLFADQLLGVMDELGIDRATLIGFSLGGMINRRFALDYPDRVASLVILNSPHERSPEAQKLVEARAANTRAGGPSANIDETLSRWFTPAYLQSQPERVAQIRDWVLGNDPVSYAACRQVLAKGVTELISPSVGIHCPALVMTCENDSGSTPSMAQAISAQLDQGQTHIIPDLQHMGLVESPEQFLDHMLPFLNQLTL